MKFVVEAFEANVVVPVPVKITLLKAFVEPYIKPERVCVGWAAVEVASK